MPRSKNSKTTKTTKTAKTSKTSKTTKAAPRRRAAARPAPSTKPLAARLFVRPGTTVALVNAPPGVEEALQPLPDGASLTPRMASGTSFALVFGKDAAELDARLAAVVPKLAAAPVLWLGYPKLGTPLAADLSRDRVVELAQGHGLEPVAQIAVDAIWSALRFKR